MSALHEQQRSFAQFILASADVRHGRSLPALKQSSSSVFEDSQRLQIYRNNFVISLCEALAGVYPVIKKLVGEEFFQHVAREYVQNYPSRTGNLHDFGDAFASFLDGLSALETLPYLPDVARLEWAHHQVFHSAENAVLNLVALTELDEGKMAGLIFQLSKSCVLLTSNYPVLHIWQINQQAQVTESISLEEGGVQCVVLRHGQHIEFHSLSSGVYALIYALMQHKNFAQACESALEVETDCDIAAALQFIVKQKIVSGFSFSPLAEHGT